MTASSTIVGGRKRKCKELFDKVFLDMLELIGILLARTWRRLPCTMFQLTSIIRCGEKRTLLPLR